MNVIAAASMIVPVVAVYMLLDWDNMVARDRRVCCRAIMPR
jgi:hypothetical protein